MSGCAVARGTRCIMLDGMLVRVSGEFDEREGSDDMLALRDMLAGIKGRIDNPPGPDDLVTKHGQGRRPAP